ncbi:MAG: efflux RND transporter periplasmic adaptor subunit [Candidatus Magasanikbacteria bacterium]|jgi:RND family efflux transporter MFP subunit|nr:efflux RND transporter periplasmic adaptor subunit [Candidatus Magasanikbacteria bacterium]
MKKKTTYLTIIITTLVLVVGIYAYSAKEGDVPEYSSVTVERTNLSQVVSETGSVTAVLELFYGWETSGRVALVNTTTGALVKKGEVVAELENSQQQARLRESRSRLASAQAALNLILAGASEQERASSVATVDQARASYSQSLVDLEKVRTASNAAVETAQLAVKEAKLGLENDTNVDNRSLTSAYEDAITDINDATVSALDAVAAVSNMQYSYSALNQRNSDGNQLAKDKGRAVLLLVGVSDGGRWQAESILGKYGGIRGEINALADSTEYDETIIDDLLNRTKEMLQATKSALDRTLTMLNSHNGSSTDKTTISTEVTSMNTEITSIVNAIQAIESSKLSQKSSDDTNDIAYERALNDFKSISTQASQDIAVAQAAVDVRKASLDQMQASHNAYIAPPRAVDTAALRADISRESANVEQFLRDLENTKLVALSDGVIADLSVDIGETVTANQGVLSINSEDVHIRVDISESDIIKVRLGNPVEITLDAFGDDRAFTGTVDSIEPAETEISGVVYYTADIVFEKSEEGLEFVRSGMTANIDIKTNNKDDVLVIPQRAVLKEDGRQFVRVLTDSATAEFAERDVMLGLRGTEGDVEVLSGLNEGDDVITFIKITQ